jgi:hypothetical protein
MCCGVEAKTGSITTDFDGFGAVKDLMEPEDIAWL